MTRRNSRYSVAATAAIAVMLLAGGISAGFAQTSEGSKWVTLDEAKALSAEDKAKLLTPAFYTAVPDADPVIVQTLMIASQPLSAEQEAIVQKCMQETKCETGTGDLVMGIADSFGDNAWRIQARLEMTAQAVQSGKVKEIIYTNGHGNLQQSQANFRSLLVQNVDIIEAYYDFASSFTALFREAQEKGVVVVSYIGPVPHGDGPADGIQYMQDYVAVGNEMAEAVKKSHPTPGNFVLFTGIAGNPTAPIWQPAVQANLEAAGWKMVFSGNTNWQPAGDMSATAAAIAHGESIDALLYDGVGPTYIIKGFERAGAKLPTLVTWGPTNEYFEQWAAMGSPDGIWIDNSQSWAPRVALTAAINRLTGTAMPGSIILPQPFVQTGDAKSYWETTMDLPAGYGPPTFSPKQLMQEFLK